MTQSLDWLRGNTKETVSLLQMEVEIITLADCRTLIPSYIEGDLSCGAAN